MAKKTEAGEEILVLHERWVRAAKAHLREIVTVVVGVVLVLCLWAGYRYYRDRRETKAVRLYVKALSEKDLEARKKILRKLVQAYSDTVAGREAGFHLWEIQLPSSSPQKALKQLLRLQKGAKGEIRVSLSLGEGYLREEMKDYRGAARLYQEVLKKAPFSVGLVSADLARVYEKMGNYRQALKYYQQFVDQKPSVEALSFVEYKLAVLKEHLGHGS
ncbi:MAG: hypothetical protein DSZ24_06670 [Thermodesulfatator sp.]|nr:MAG: hypothetical protein DSZ24_06670 [Thermodesulfatator sp.]